MKTLGCDPGLSGAVALWNDDLRALIIHDAPVLHIKVGKAANRTVYNDAAYANLIRALAPDRAVIEKVNGIMGQAAGASFNFGAGYGLLRGILAAMNVPVEFVSPPVWRARLRVPPGKDGSRFRASQIFPAYASLFARAKDDGRAEASLMSVCTP